MTDGDKAALIADLERYAPIPQPLRPGDLTIEDVMATKEIARAAAVGWLNRLVKAGRLAKGEAISPETGKRINVYRRMEA